MIPLFKFFLIFPENLVCLQHCFLVFRFRPGSAQFINVPYLHTGNLTHSRLNIPGHCKIHKNRRNPLQKPYRPFLHRMMGAGCGTDYGINLFHNQVPILIRNRRTPFRHRCAAVQILAKGHGNFCAGIVQFHRHQLTHGTVANDQNFLPGNAAPQILQKFQGAFRRTCAHGRQTDLCLYLFCP